MPLEQEPIEQTVRMDQGTSAPPIEQTIEAQTSSADLVPADEMQTLDATAPSLGAPATPDQIETMVPDAVSEQWELAGDSQNIDATIQADYTVPRDLSKITLQQRVLSGGPTAKKLDEEMDADYEIKKFLAEGGMGAVYVANQSSMQRQVAIKTLKNKRSDKESEREKFLYEALITGDLDHPNIVPIHDVGVSNDGTVFYSMKLVKGTPWEKVIKGNSLTENLEILNKVFDAMSFSHSRNIIHRDLKPENIMLGEFGEVLVMDWGLGVDLDDDRNMTLGGTPAYMSPEMATNRVDLINQLSDIYLLGSILFEIITGRPPHRGKTITECVNHAARNAFVDAPQGDDLIEIALIAMSTRPQDRYQSVQEFKQAIREYQQHAESNSIAARASDHLEKAKEEKDYESFNRAKFGFEEAIKLWGDNQRAKTGLKDTRLSYAKLAYKREDFDLGLSILDHDEPTKPESELYDKTRVAIRERKAKTRRIAQLRQTIFAGIVIALIGTVVGGTMIFLQRNEAITQRKLAQANEKIAKDETAKAKESEKKAKDATEIAKQQRDFAEKQTKAAQYAREEEAKAKDAAIESKKIAEKAALAEAKAKRDAVAAKELAVKNEQNAIASEQKAIANKKQAEQNEIVALFGKFRSQINLANSHIQNGRIQLGYQQLEQIRANEKFPVSYKNWELYRLYHLCHDEVPRAELAAAATAITKSPDGTIIAVADATGRVQFVDAATSKPTENALVIPRDLKSRTISSIAWSKTRNLIAVGIRGNNPENVYVFDAETQQLKYSFNAHSSSVLQLEFVRDSSRLLTCGVDEKAPYQQCALWSLRGDQPPKAPRDSIVFGKAIRRFAYAPDRKFIATILSNGSVKFWQLSGKKRKSFANWTYSESPITHLSFDPSDERNRRFFAATENGQMVLAELTNENNRVAVNVIDALQAHNTKVTLLKTRDTSTDKDRSIVIMTGDEDGNLTMWNLSKNNSKKKLVGHRGKINDAVIVNENVTFTASADQTVRRWDSEKYFDELNLDVRQFTSTESQREFQTISAINSDSSGEKMIVADNRGNLAIWNSADQKVLTTWSVGQKAGRKSQARFFPESNRVISFSETGELRVWDVETQQTICSRRNLGSNLHFEANKDATKVYFVHPNRRDTIVELNVDTNEPTNAFRVSGWKENYRTEISTFAINESANQLIVGTTGRGFSVIDIESASPVWTMPFDAKFEGSRFKTIRMIPDSNRFMTMVHDQNEIRLWSLENGKTILNNTISLGNDTKNFTIDDIRTENGQTFIAMRSTELSQSIVQIWTLTRLLARSNAAATRRFDSEVTIARFADSSNQLVVAERNGIAQWNWRTDIVKTLPQWQRLLDSRKITRSRSGRLPAMNSIDIQPGKGVMLAGSGYVFITTPSQTADFQPEPAAISVAYDSRQNIAFALHRDNKLRRWKLSDNKQTSVGDSMIAQGDYAAMTLSPNHKFILAKTTQNKFVILKADSLEALEPNPLTDLNIKLACWNPAHEFLGGTKSLEDIEDFAGGKPAQPTHHLFAVNSDNSLIGFDLNEPKSTTIRKLAAEISHLSVDSKGKFAIVDTVDRELLITLAEPNMAPFELTKSNDSTITQTSFNTEQNRLLIGRSNGSVTIWNFDIADPRLLQPVLNLGNNQTPILLTQFTPNGKQIIIAAKNQKTASIFLTSWKE